MSDLQLHSRGPLADIAVRGRHGSPTGAAGITVQVVPDPAIILVTASRSADNARERLSRALQDELPETPRAVFGQDRTILWSGPDAWLLIRGNQKGSGEATAHALAESVGTAGAVVDLTDSRALVTVAGPRARPFFEKGVAVDLHPRSFRTGDTAITLISHVPLQIWQINDAPTYGMLIPRATAEHVWHWLEASAAEYGLDVITA